MKYVHQKFLNNNLIVINYLLNKHDDIIINDLSIFKIVDEVITERIAYNTADEMSTIQYFGCLNMLMNDLENFL
jgi:hypothetical protein